MSGERLQELSCVCSSIVLLKHGQHEKERGSILSKCLRCFAKCRSICLSLGAYICHSYPHFSTAWGDKTAAEIKYNKSPSCSQGLAKARDIFEKSSRNISSTFLFSIVNAAQYIAGRKRRNLSITDGQCPHTHTHTHTRATHKDTKMHAHRLKHVQNSAFTNIWEPTHHL